MRRVRSFRNNPKVCASRLTSLADMRAYSAIHQRRAIRRVQRGKAATAAWRPPRRERTREDHRRRGGRCDGLSFFTPILALVNNQEQASALGGGSRDEAASDHPEQHVEKMYEYGYRKSNIRTDELVTDAHGNPISVVDAMLKAEDAAKSTTITPQLCYYSPRIPGNTGSAIRLCAVTGTILHLVEPLGFNLQDTKLRRAGLDYHDMAHVVLHPNFQSLIDSMPGSRIIAFTAHATKLYTEVQYRPSDILLFGPEPGDIPDPMDIMAGPHVAEQVRLPMRPSLRSLNLTNCASIAIYEAWRQLGFNGGN